MDKISIVKRRQRNSFDEPLWGERAPIHLEEHSEENDPMLRLHFSPGESKFIPLTDPEKGTLKILSGIAIDQPTVEEGQVTFNFRLKTDETLKMLKPDQVCQMLQVSRTFLRQLVRDRRLRSYKFGRLRRFLLADVIDYLTRNEESRFARAPKNNEPSVLVPKYNN